jgi:hypothetical protein
MDNEPFALRNPTPEDDRAAATLKRERTLARAAETRRRNWDRLVAKNRRQEAVWKRSRVIKRAIYRHACALARYVGVEPPPMPESLKPRMI